MKILDSRRITGPSFFTEKPGAMIDVTVPTEKSNDVIAEWELSVRTFLNGFGWTNEITQYRKYKGSVSLFMSAPIDALYSACDVNETAFQFSILKNLNSFDVELKRLKKLIDEESDPAILKLKNVAKKHGVKFLQSDDIISVGTGTGCRAFRVDKIPKPSDIDWSSIHDIPIGLITGTNGKSTSVRLMESILFEAGITSGASSPDGIRVARKTVESGDYSGPEGARSTLRNPQVEMAVLEVARGGMLRRGLPVRNVDAALITNIANDHFGDYGVNSISEMATTKFIVSKGLKDEGILILNADDNAIIENSKNCSKSICWFSLNSNNPRLLAHIHKGGMGAYLDDDKLIFVNNKKKIKLMHIHDIPITMKGIARYNISNSLGALCLAKAIHIENKFIINGLKNFTSSFENNPGRCNYFEKKGISILLDFAHNPHGLSALLELANHFPAKRKLILLSQAGDRSNADIENLVQKAMALNPAQVHIADVAENYQRGRNPGEIIQVFKNAFLSSGLTEKYIDTFSSFSAGVKGSLEWAEEGGFLLLLVLDDLIESKKMIDDFE